MHAKDATEIRRMAVIGGTPRVNGPARATGAAFARRLLRDDLKKAIDRVNEHRPIDWSRKLAAYRRPALARRVIELAITARALLGLWGLAWTAFHIGLWWLALLLAIPAGGFLVRLFMIQHDCGHGSFFEGRAANDWVGRILGLFTLTPYDYWRRTHAMHHATSGNLDRRGLGAIDTLTVE